MKKENAGAFAEQLAQLLPEVIRWFHLNRMKNLEASKLNPAQFFVLELIVNSGPCKMSDLAGRSCVSLPAITRMVDKLCDMKLAERMRSTNDRRVIRISITAKGRKMVAVFNEHRKKTFIDMFAAISVKDRRDYLRIMKKIHSVANKKRGIVHGGKNI